MERREEGMALIAVLWISAILSSLVLAGGYIAKLELRKADYALKEIQAVNIAYSGVMSVKRNLLFETNDYDSLNGLWKNDPENYSNVKIGDGTLNVSVEDCESKVNINSMPDVTAKLAPVMLNANSSEIIDSIKDWIDADSNVNSMGAEDSYYMSLNPAYHCKNVVFDSIDELYLIKGLNNNRDAVPAIINLTTAHSDGVVNVNTAPIDVLKALPGIDEKLAQEIVAHRSGKDYIDRTPDDEPFADGNELKDLAGEVAYGKFHGLITTRSSFFEVKSTARIGRVVKTVESLLERRAGTVKIVYWREL